MSDIMLKKVCLLSKYVRKHKHCSTAICSQCGFLPHTGVCLLDELGMSISKGDVGKATKVYYQLKRKVYGK